MSSPKNRPAFNVSVKSGTEEKAFWTRIGVAFKSEHGGYSIHLDAHPIGKQMWLFPAKPAEARADK